MTNVVVVPAGVVIHEPCSYRFTLEGGASLDYEVLIEPGTADPEDVFTAHGRWEDNAWPINYYVHTYLQTEEELQNWLLKVAESIGATTLHYRQEPYHFFGRCLDPSDKRSHIETDFIEAIVAFTRMSATKLKDRDDYARWRLRNQTKMLR